jgi:peptidyl-prolyl cis-trans isomerase A (cyclophilin A)
VRRLVLIPVVLALAACGGSGKHSSDGTTSTLLHPEKLTETAPATYAVTFHTSEGTFVVHVQRSLAPKGADRLYNLAKNGFFTNVKFFRVVPGFVVQFGISPDPKISAAWRSATIPDDPVKAHNTRGALTFASAGPDTRTTQLFINLANNTSLDANGFAPVGTVTKGMDVVDKLYSGYGEAPSQQQGAIMLQGNAYLDKHYPKLDEITSATVSSS